MVRGKFPDVLKLAQVTPVFKKDDDKCMSNYRPIAVLPIFSKVFEKVLCVRLMDFFTKNNIISPLQYGFQRSVSTTHAIQMLTNEIYKSLNKREHNLSIFIDICKAFDTVNHSILIRKLQYYGVRGVAADYMRSYLSNRKQCVKVGSNVSRSVDVNSGIPQGSVAGPILFLIYINDLPNVSKKLSCILFADDTTFSASSPCHNELMSTVSVELDNVKRWTFVNRLSLNMSKTYYLLFSNRRRAVGDSLKLCLNGAEIERESEIKLSIYEYLR